MNIFGKTDIGCVRQSNQDAFYNTILSDDAVLSVVCDGMGGAAAGNVASGIAVEVIGKYITNSFDDRIKSENIDKLLRAAIQTANIEVYDAAQKEPSYLGMGTTTVVALVANNVAHIAHVGDSRAYLINEGKAIQITKDHSMVQKLVESGALTFEEAQRHPKKNVITRAIGIGEEVSVDYNEVNLDDMVLLLCTDGLSGVLSNDEIAKTVVENSLADVPDKLTEFVNSRHGNDNVTVTVISK